MENDLQLIALRLAEINLALDAFAVAIVLAIGVLSAVIMLNGRK